MDRLDKFIGLAIIALSGICAVLWVVAPQQEVSPIVGQAIEFGFFPCEREDSPGPCYWDASQHGNGTGSDFVVTADNRVFRDCGTLVEGEKK